MKLASTAGWIGLTLASVFVLLLAHSTRWVSITKPTVVEEYCLSPSELSTLISQADLDDGAAAMQVRLYYHLSVKSSAEAERWFMKVRDRGATEAASWLQNIRAKSTSAKP